MDSLGYGIGYRIFPASLVSNLSTASHWGKDRILNGLPIDFPPEFSHLLESQSVAAIERGCGAVHINMFLLAEPWRLL